MKPQSSPATPSPTQPQAVFAEHTLQHSRLTMLHLVDYWGGADGPENERITQRKMKPFKGRYKLMKMLTTDAIQQFADGQLDYVYIDATHNYGDVRRELSSYYRKVKVKRTLATAFDSPALPLTMP